jgi:hypothetical protein
MRLDGKGLEIKGLRWQEQWDAGDGMCRFGEVPDEREANAGTGANFVLAKGDSRELRFMVRRKGKAERACFVAWFVDPQRP